MTFLIQMTLFGIFGFLITILIIGAIAHHKQIKKDHD